MFALVSGTFSDRHESFYASLSEARKNGAVDRGWVPDDILPDSSHKIRELHNLSPSREWCAFEFASGDSEKLGKSLSSIDVLPASVRRIPNPDVLWWPNALKGDIDPQRLRNFGFSLYVVERPANSVMTEISLFAVDWTKGQAFFYSTYKSEVDR